MRIRGVGTPSDHVGKFRVWSAIATILVTLLIATLLPTVGVGRAASTSSPRLAHHSVRVGHTAPHPPTPPHLGLVGRVHPSASTDTYTQQGMTIAQINGGNSVGVASLIEDVKTVTSPYPIAYELNGLSDVGDWFQITLADNWPGCPGFAELMEVWSNIQGSGPVVCDTTVSFTSGDVIQLELNFTTGGVVCMDFTKISTSTKHIVCQAPPDTGGTKWAFLSTISDSNGFYTGPMTEVLNLSASSSCPDYTVMPELSYLYPANFFVTQETPWSDQFDLFSGVCYYSSNSLDTFSVGDRTTHFFDTAAGTSYGPHWSGAQNYSMMNPGYGWRYQTDPNPITSVTGSAYPVLVTPNSAVLLNSSVVGGYTPYQSLWYLNGTSLGYQPASFTWTAPAIPGSYPFTVYGVDAEKNVYGPTSLTVKVVGPLVATGIRLTPLSGTLDLGQSITLTAVFSGGIPPYHFAWSGLPSGCVSANLARLPCTPASVGTSSVHVAVSDTNGSLQSAGPVVVQVAPDPSVNVSASGPSFDLGSPVIITATASGGTSIFTFTWSFLPPGCLSLNASRLRCVPSVAGGYGVYVTANDTDGFSTFGGPASFSIAPDPSVTIHSNRSQVEVGEGLTLSASPQGGSGAITLSWTGLPLGCTASNASQIVCVLSGSGGVYNVGASVRDGAGYSARATPVEVRVFPALSAQLSASPLTIAAGGTTVLSLNATGGIPNLSFHWSGLPTSCTLNPNGLTATCTSTPSGHFTVTVLVVDSSGVARTTSATFTVTPAPATNSGGLFAGSLLLPLLIVVLAAVALIVGLAIRGRRRPPVEPAAPAESSDPWVE